MAKRIPVQTVIVHRDGKRVSPPIGQPFDFTADEIKSLTERNPDAIRKVNDESKLAPDQHDDEDDLDARQEAEAAAADKAEKAAAKKAAKTGGDKTDDDDL